MEENPRQLDAKVCKPFVYGSIAFWQGKKADEFKTHKWTIYLRGVECEDLSYFIEKVVFHLHPSFPEPTRVIKTPPFELSEFGWGEFEIRMEVFFKDLDEPRIGLYHQLKLYPGIGQQPSLKKPVLSEKYDQFVFKRPRLLFYKQLTETVRDDSGQQHPLKEYFGSFKPEEDIQKIAVAQAYVDRELTALKQRLINEDAELEKLNNKLNNYEKHAIVGE